MIPHTFPSVLDVNGKRRMVTYTLPSIAGLIPWLDFIPIKDGATNLEENSYSGNILMEEIASTSGKQAWLIIT